MARLSRCWALVLAACQAGGDSAPLELPAAGLEDEVAAATLLEPGTALPSRAEVVALTDRLTIAATDLEAPDQLRLTLLAARLRERIWRSDGSETDAREALELYRQVAKKAGGAEACVADLERARLSAEMSRDASQAYREIYLTLERHGDVEGAEACTRRLRAMLVRAEAFRPSGQQWEALQREAASESPSEPPAPAPSETRQPVEGADEVVVVPEQAGKRAVLTGVLPYSYPKGGRVVLELDTAARYETGVLAPDPKAGRGHRVYLDLLGVRMKGVKNDIEAEGLIERIRLGKHRDATRVVLDLSEEARRRVYYLPDPFRVIIDVSPKTDPIAEATKPTEKAKGRLVRRITLDPGHGGWDAGAVGPTGLREKDVALDIAHRAAPALASELSVETMLTRDKDVFVELEERTARANAFQSDLFVSIHCNATENGQATGYEVFILDPTREQDRSALRAVARENHARRGGGMDPGELDAQLNAIARGLTFASTTESARTFADLLRTTTQASLGLRYPKTHDHGVKTAGFFVLVGAHMPAVLYETSFISNPDDEARLATADYRQKLADAIVNAVKAYMEGR